MIADCGMRNSDCRKGAGLSSVAPIPHSEIRNPHLRRGITLVELLITMAIIAIITAAIMGTARAAMESARRSRTQSLVTKIGGLLNDRMGSYQTRRVDIADALLTGPDGIETKLRSGAITPIERGHMLADLRLLATRELIKYEMPDRWSDVVGDRVTNSNANTVLMQPPQVLSAPPALAQTYYRRLRGLNTNGDVLGNQGAECLYLTVMNATGDGEARTLFSDQDIGDTDGDGALEFLDGWGRAIQYIRWPAGFVDSPLMSADAEADHDPVDIYRRDSSAVTMPQLDRYPQAVRPLIDDLRKRIQKALTNNNPRFLAFRTVPLVYSGGSDGDPDIFQAKNALIFDPYDEYSATGEDDPNSSDAIVAQLGSPMNDVIDPSDDGDNWKDNIHNHLNEY